MKKRLSAILICSLLLVSVLALGLTMGLKTLAYAADEEDPIPMPERNTEIKWEDGWFTCRNFFRELLNISNANRAPNMRDITFTAGEFEGLGVLDLTGTGKIDDDKIASIGGIEVLFLGGIHTILLDGNLIEEISDIYMDKMVGVRKLGLSNNKLSVIDFTSLNTFYYVDLSNNNLSGVDVQSLAPSDDVSIYTAGRAYLNLEQNNFSKLENITLPPFNKVPVDIYLTGNNLIDAQKTDFPGHNVSLQFQGFKESYTEGDLIRITSDDALMPNVNGKHNICTDLKAVVTFRSESINYNENNPDLEAMETIDGYLELVPGRLHITFLDGLIEINTGIYETKNIDVKPKAPTFKMIDNKGKTITHSQNQHNSDFKVLLISQSAVNIIPYVKFSDDDKDFTNSDTIEIVSRGLYLLEGQVEYDSVKSETTYITVNCTLGGSFGWALIIIFGLAILGIATYYGVKWYRNGAVVAPLSDKEVSNMERRRGR